MDEREYSHRLGKKRTSFLNENARSADVAKTANTDAQKGKLNLGDTADCFYSDLLVADTGLAEMWMELRV